MLREQTRTTGRSRRQVLVASAAGVAAISAAVGNDEASAASTTVLKHKVKDMDRELKRMAPDIVQLEGNIERLADIPGLEEISAEMLLILWRIDGKRKIALHR